MIDCGKALLSAPKKHQNGSASKADSAPSPSCFVFTWPELTDWENTLAV